MMSTSLIRTLVLAAIVANLAVPAVALGGSNAAKTSQLSPTERIVLQENARRRDPAIYGGTWVVGFPGVGIATQLSPAERIAIQEDARRRDPAIYGGTWVIGFPALPAPSPARPVVEVVGSEGFGWTDAGVGAGAALALVLLAVGATVLARSGRLTKA